MGRKSKDKFRKDDFSKKSGWAVAAFPHFQKLGIKDINMDELAAELGISKATLYKYYASKSELLATSVQLTIEQLQFFAIKLNEPGLDYYERFFNAFHYLISITEKFKAAFIEELRINFPELYTELKNFESFALIALKSYYMDGIASGDVAKDLNVNFLVAQDELIIRSTTCPGFLNRHKLETKKALKDFIDVKFKGLEKR